MRSELCDQSFKSDGRERCEINLGCLNNPSVGFARQSWIKNFKRITLNLMKCKTQNFENEDIHKDVQYGSCMGPIIVVMIQ